MTGQMHVLLVEDDPMIGEAVQAALEDESHVVEWLKDGETASCMLRGRRFDIVLLDLGLPGRDGLALLAGLRAVDNGVPVVVVTARDATEDRVHGLDAGADDYLVKPFEITELKARMRAVLRRQGGTGTPALGNGVVALDLTTRRASVRGHAAVPLSQREFALLRVLMLRPGAIFSRADLERRIYGPDEKVESNAVEYLIYVLRKKLGSSVVKNVRGLGWMVSRES